MLTTGTPPRWWRVWSRKIILGVEAALWTETITNLDDLEYMVFPRLLGIAEVGWSPASVRSWDTYRVRLGKQKDRFEAMDINYYPSALVPMVGGSVGRDRFGITGSVILHGL